MKKRYAFLSKNWLRLGLVVAINVSSPIGLFAQIVPAKQWDKTFGGNSIDQLYTVKQTSDGGYILGGTSQSGINGDKSQASQGSHDYWVVKLDANGSKVWDKTYGGNHHEQLRSGTVLQTSDGGYILGGYSFSNLSGDKTQAAKGGFDIWLVKLDANGNKTWDKAFGGSQDDVIFSIQQTSDGGYILGGTSASGISSDKSQVSQGDSDYWIVKLDSGGNKIWDKTYGGSMSDNLHSIQQTSDGGYILGGNSFSGQSGDKSQPSNGNEDYWIVKLDVNGNKIWDRSFGGSGFEQLRTIRQTIDGGYILGGFSDSGISNDKTQPSQGTDDYWVVKLNSTGIKTWDKTYGGSSTDLLTSLHQTLSGDYILGGYSSSPISGDKTQASHGYSDFWLVKLDVNGNKVWDKAFGGSGSDELHSFQRTSDFGYVLGGFSDSEITGDKSQASKGGYDFWIVKLGADITGTNELLSSAQITIFPNPSQGKFKLQLENIAASKIEVIVTDLLGRVILQNQLPVVNNQVSEELEIKAAKGMYLLQIKAGNQTTSRKIVVE